jgi:hypothetical protein
MERKRRTSGRSTTQLADGEPSTEEVPAKREKVTPCIQYTDVTAASFRIRKGVKETPLKKSEPISEMLGMNIFFKKEFLLPTGR